MNFSETPCGANSSGAAELLPVVGLGGSAGSMKALQSFFSATPPDTGWAFVVVTHLSPDHVSILAEILQRSTSMPVIQVQEDVQIGPNRVFVIPPGKHLLLINGRLTLEDTGQLQGKRVAVDLLFRSLAKEDGIEPIGIVLSGGDGDGAMGIKHIKEKGGLTIAQEPLDAEHDGMPCSAIATGAVDWVLNASDMPSRIREYRNLGTTFSFQTGDLSKASDIVQLEPDPENEEEALIAVLVYLKARTGRDFTYYKKATILRRIARRMQLNAVETIEEYSKFLRLNPGEVPALLQDLLISVTNFFRDKDAFEGLAAEIPTIFSGKVTGGQVRVWVPGCATGEEAYSVAMLLKEYADSLSSPPSLQIFATDLDEGALHRARMGIYHENIVADVSAERLARFFTPQGGGMQIKRNIREMVLFAAHDLFRDPPFSRLDLVTCRNLFIYVNREMQDRALDVFHFALRPEGRLFLGSAESAEDSPAFETLNKKLRLYMRSSIQRPSPLGFNRLSIQSPNLQVEPIGLNPGITPVFPTPPERGGMEPWMYFMQAAAPPSAVVDTNFSITHVFGGIGKWLTFQSGEISHDLLRVVHPELQSPVHAALIRAREEKVNQMIRGITLEVQGIKIRVNIRILVNSLSAPGHSCIIFDEQSLDAQEGEIEAEVATSGVIRHLEEELEVTRQNLRETISRYESSTEELRAGHEELQAMNEELLSTGEELETGREEMHSLNEELQTVNQELKQRIEDVNESHSDLQNLMDATTVATIFLDRELKIKQYTPSAELLYKFIPGDIGRPLFDLSHRFEYPEIEQDARSVFTTLAPIEREVKTHDGRWYWGRIQPYRTVDDRIAGVVLTFIDVTVRREAELLLLKAQEHLKLIFESATDYAIISIDPGQRVVSWSAGAQKMFGFTENEIIGQPYDRIFTPDDQARALPSQELNTVMTAGSLRTEGWYLQKEGVVFWGSGTMRVMKHQDGSVLGYVKILRDQTESKKALEEMKSARAEAESAVRTKDHFLAVLSHELRTPLTPILLTAGALQMDKEVSDTVKESLQMIEQNVNLEIRMIEDLLEMTRLTHRTSEISKTPVDMHELIQNCVSICRGDLEEKHLKCVLLLEADSPVVLGDSLRLQQTIWNLLKNACKFSPNQGNITVKTSNQKSLFLVDITDTGIGIEAAALEKIFDPFHQANATISRRFGGLGLGLAICKAAITAHGGTLHVKSEGMGTGATFTISLPLGV